MGLVEPDRDAVADEPLPSVRRLADATTANPSACQKRLDALELLRRQAELEELAASRDVVRVPLAGRKRARLDERDRLAARDP